MPLSNQHIRTDRGHEFLHTRCRIVFGSGASSSELSGRAHPTTDPELEDSLAPSQLFYNWDWPHDNLDRRSPIDRVCDLVRHAPSGEEIAANYDPNHEFIVPRNYWLWADDTQSIREAQRLRAQVTS